MTIAAKYRALREEVRDEIIDHLLANGFSTLPGGREIGLKYGGVMVEVKRGGGGWKTLYFPARGPRRQEAGRK